MRVYREQYTRDGKRRRTRKWYVDFVDHYGRRHRLPGFDEKRSTEALARNLEGLVACRVAGQSPTADLQRWIEVLPERIRTKLVSWDLLDPRRTEGAKPLRVHLEDWERSLKAKGNTESYVQMKVSRARKVVEGCGFKYWSDISASKTEAFLARLQSDAGAVSAQTRNFYLQAIQQFCRWMVQDGRAPESPIAHLKGVNVQTDRRHDRRSLEPEEIARLLAATAAAERRFGMDGYQRALLYRLAIETGLRASELRSLTPASFDFTSRLVRVAAAYSKHRREDEIPLRKDTAAEIQQYAAGKMPGVQLFPVPAKPGQMLKADLVEAGIPYVDEAGRYADFHSLRHTFGTMLAASGVHPKVAQSLMRHSDINLTMSRYTHTVHGQLARAVESLPDLACPPNSESQVRTGTDDRPISRSAICSAKSMSEHCIDLRRLTKRSLKTSKGQYQARSPEETISGQNRDSDESRPAGLEPATSGLGNRCSILLSYGRL